MKKYDGRFKDIFEELYEAKYKTEFQKRGTYYIYYCLNKRF